MRCFPRKRMLNFIRLFIILHENRLNGTASSSKNKAHRKRIRLCLVHMCMMSVFIPGFFPALRTQPFKKCSVPGNQIPALLGCTIVQRFVVSDRQIAYGLTPGADHMVMFIRTEFIAVAPRKFYPKNISRLFEYVQIPVNSAAADSMVDQPYFQIDLIGTRMIKTVHKRIQNQLTLSCFSLYQVACASFLIHHPGKCRLIQCSMAKHGQFLNFIDIQPGRLCKALAVFGIRKIAVHGMTVLDVFRD